MTVYVSTRFTLDMLRRAPITLVSIRLIDVGTARRVITNAMHYNMLRVLLTPIEKTKAEHLLALNLPEPSNTKDVKLEPWDKLILLDLENQDIRLIELNYLM